MMDEIWDDTDTGDAMGTSVIGWQAYYGADDYLAPTDPGTWTDEVLARYLGVELRDLADAGIGTTFCVVRAVRASYDATDDLHDCEAWFVHGDPWRVLIGVSASRIVVGSVDMFAGGYAGPSTLTCRNPASFEREGVDLTAIASAVIKARRSTARRMTRCALCDSPRYGPGCRCDDIAYGIIYD